MEQPALDDTHQLGIPVPTDGRGRSGGLPIPGLLHHPIVHTAVVPLAAVRHRNQRLLHPVDDGAFVLWLAAVLLSSSGGRGRINDTAVQIVVVVFAVAEQLVPDHDRQDALSPPSLHPEGKGDRHVVSKLGRQEIPQGRPDEVVVHLVVGEGREEVGLGWRGGGDICCTGTIGGLGGPPSLALFPTFLCPLSLLLPRGHQQLAVHDPAGPPAHHAHPISDTAATANIAAANAIILRAVEVPQYLGHPLAGDGVVIKVCLRRGRR